MTLIILTYPFQLLIKDRNGNEKTLIYKTVQECVDAAKKYPPAMYESYQISVVLEYHKHDDPRPTNYKWPHEKLKIS